MRRKCFYEAAEGEWLQAENWWFLAWDSGGDAYVIHERYSLHATRKGVGDVVMATMSVEAALARKDIVATKLRAALAAEADGDR